MSDEGKLRQEVDRGARAKALLEGDLLNEAFASLEREYTRAWKDSPTRDTDGRERLWTALTVLTKVKDHLNNMIINGRVAQAALDQLLSASQQKKR